MATGTVLLPSGSQRGGDWANVSVNCKKKKKKKVKCRYVTTLLLHIGVPDPDMKQQRPPGNAVGSSC